MANEVTIAEVRTMAISAFQSGLFGIKNQDQAFIMMCIAQSENLHPVQAMQMYDVIQGRPALKSTEVLARYMDAKGKIEWLETTATKAKARFTHPSSGSFEYEYTIEDAQLANLASKDNWKTRPKEMLRARCVSSGVRMSYPRCLNNLYSSDEVQDMEVEAPVEQIEEVEIVESNIKDLKRSLATKLKREFNYTDGMIKDFAIFFDLADNGELIQNLLNDDKVLNDKIKEFEEN